MQDAFDHPGRRRRRRSPTGAPQASKGNFLGWGVSPRNYGDVGTKRDLAMLSDERTLNGGGGI
ncbi:MAG: hypothetical protein LLG16_05905 [Euryarchaeota archaeon]|nr:hypothetical protein [Euryarchaeota archaeon]